MFLDNRLRLTIDPGLFSSSVLSMLTASSGFFTAVEPLDSDQYPYLLGQIYHPHDEHSARISFLAPGDLNHPGFLSVLACLTHMAGESGALQILAEVDQNNPIETILVRAGFRPYADQQIWKIPHLSKYAAEVPAWVPIDRDDQDQVLSFFHHMVPAQVQRVEIPHGMDSLQGLLYKEDGEIAGIALTGFGPQGILTDMVIEPNLDGLEDLLKTMITQIPCRDSRNIYLRVRSYQQRIASALERIGATPGPDQKAVVKRLAVHYNAKQAFRVRGFENQPDITTPISNTKIKN
jgi:hypothetical protein